MNLLLLEDRDRCGDRFVVSGVRARHIREVLGATVGREIRVGLVDGLEGTGQVVAMNDDRVELSCQFAEQVRPRPRLDLVIAIPRPKSLRKLLPEVAAFGVNRIFLLRTWRVAKPFLSASVLRPDHLRPLLREGMMQGRHTHEPLVEVEPLFRPFVQDRAPTLFADHDCCIVAHPSASNSIAGIELRPDHRVVAVVGPEGGLIPYEVACFESLGFRTVRMGPSPLRVETACVALLAQLQLLGMIATHARG